MRPEDEYRIAAQLARVMAVACVRNTQLETLHAGLTPVSYRGDGSDVVVEDAAGRRIPWSEVSRISDDEMRALMREIVDRLFFGHRLLSAEGRRSPSRSGVPLLMTDRPRLVQRRPELRRARQPDRLQKRHAPAEQSRARRSHKTCTLRRACIRPSATQRRVGTDERPDAKGLNTGRPTPPPIFCCPTSSRRRPRSMSPTMRRCGFSTGSCNSPFSTVI